MIALEKHSISYCCWKDIVSCALFLKKLMCSSHFRSWEIIVPKKQKGTTVPTGRSCRVIGLGCS